MIEARPELTEQAILDLLRERHADRGNGGSGRYAFATHVRSRSGFAGVEYDRTTATFGSRLRTFDAVAIGLWQSSDHLIDIFEVKTTRSDWLRELADPDKTAAALERADRFWIVAPAGIVKATELGDGWGLIEVLGGNAGAPWRLRQRLAATTRSDSPTMLPRSFVVSLLRSIPGAVPGARSDSGAA